MRRTPKETAWRRNRKFGDVHGGRTRPRLVDNVFNRQHSLQPPGPHDERPITITDNPSRDFFFPVTADEVLATLRSLPSDHVATLTHVWLRRVRKRDFAAAPQASFICGSGVRLVVLYPWPRDMLLRLGAKEPQGRALNQYRAWCTNLIQTEGEWALRWTEESLRRYYLEHLVLHEVGHHVDWYQRHWSKANAKQVEDFADNYAACWSASGKQEYKG